MECFAHRLRKAREAAGFASPEALSIAIGLAHSTVRRYENGETSPGAEALREIAVALRVTTDWLLGLSLKGGAR